MSLYKTSRCRFFTPQGRPLRPYCSKGDACRYLHPNDAKWVSTERYKPFSSRTSAPFSAPKASRMRTKTSGSSTPLAPVRHSSPLVSQSDLFRLNADDDFPDVETPRSSYGYDPEDSRDRIRQPKRFERSLEGPDARDGKRFESRFDSGSSNYSKPSTSRFDSKSSNRNFSSNEARRDKDRKWSKVQSVERERAFTEIISRAREVSSKGVTDNVRTPGASRNAEVPSDGRKSTEKVVELFKNLASLSNQAVQDTAAYNQEEKKLKNYTELSSTLSKISASATKAVAPTLAGVIANRAKCKERVENDFIKLGYLWEDIFTVFVQGVVGAIDGGLQDALATLKKEGEKAVSKVVASGAGSLKRKAAVSDSLSSDGREGRSDSLKETTSTSSQGFDGEGGDTQSRKRRRLASSSLESHQEGEDVVLKIEDVDASVMAMLQDMKMKMERQAQTVEMLTQENNDLKVSLNNSPNLELAVQSGSSPSHRNSSFFSCASNPEHEQNDLNQSLHDTDADESCAVEDILMDHQLSEAHTDFQSNHRSATPL